MNNSKGKSKINYNKVEYNGHTFDSTTEFEYYQYLKFTMKEDGIKEIILQPEFILQPEYEVKCWRCNGTGKVLNKKTGRINKCRRRICKDGIVTKQAITYTADFKLIYEDGKEVVLDVKGYRGQDRNFNLKKRMFEAKYGKELIIVTHTSKGWKWQT